MPNLRFTDDNWENIERDTMLWWEGELNRPLVYLAITDQGKTKPFRFMSNYPLDLPVDRVIDHYEDILVSTSFYGDGFPWLWVNFGPGIVAGFLGAEVNSVKDPSETVWFTASDIKSIEDINFKFDSGNAWWQRVRAITSGLVERFGADLAVSHTDLGGNLDILASFRATQNLLMDLIDQPETIEKLVDKITDLWIHYHSDLDRIIRPACRGTSCWTPIWSNEKTYMLQCDFSYMISPDMFERFVLPDLSGCCDYLEHGFYHLDGKGQIPHLDMLLSIERLKGIQWIPGDGQPSPENWLPLLKRIRDGGKLCQVFVSPEGAYQIAKNLGGEGFLFVINAPRDYFNNEEEINIFLKSLAIK